MFRRSVVITALIGLLASANVVHAQRRVVVKLNPSTVDVAEPSRLSPALRATVEAQATFIGALSTGDPVIEIPANVSPSDATANLEKLPTVMSVENIAAPIFYRLDELIVLYDQSPSLDQKAVADMPVVERSQQGAWVTVRSTNGFDSKELLAIAGAPGVRFVEPNYVYSLLQTPPSNDTHLTKLWGMNKIGTHRVWPFLNKSNVLVAVLDTGMSVSHEDLTANVWSNPKEKKDGKDDDKNGFVDDIHGADFSDKDGDPSDPKCAATAPGCAHGTHVAGTVGGVGNNGKGVAGVNWSVKMMAIRMLRPAAPDTNPNAPGSGIAAAIDYAVTNGAKVISNSWGGGPFSQAIADAITRAEKAGALFVAAAGNGGADLIGDDNDATPTYPASYTHSNIISVASIDENDKLAASSNFGKTSVDLAAPGVGIYSTVLANSYDFKSGTSMATPHVSGAIALVWAHPKFEKLSASEIKKLILDNVRKVDTLKDKTVTGGVLDLAFVPDGQKPSPSGASPAAPPSNPEKQDPAPSPPKGQPGQKPVNLEGRIRADYEIGSETTGFVLVVQKGKEQVPTGKIELEFKTEAL
jgi:subtilisin family serine protease